VTKTVLITGASGLVGTAAVETFLRKGWEVVAVSRRRPDVAADTPFRHLAVDLRDEAASREAFAGLSEVSHLAYTALHEKADLVAGWSERDQMETNEAMLRNVVEPLLDSGGLRHVSILQGTKAYGVHLHPIPIPAREDAPRDDHENAFFLQEDYVKAKATERGLSYTVLRPQLIVGRNHGVTLNVVTAIGAYAAIRREEGLPFSFPGGPSFVWEAADARIVADVLEWAAGAPQADGQIFNVTNGDVFEWRNLWPTFAEVLGVQVGPDEPASMVTYLRERTAVWDKVVARYGLEPLSLEQVVGTADHHADFCFAYGAPEGPRAFVSTVKLRQAGFTETMHTLDSFRDAFQALIDRRILPPAS
jgi:nucleoside-diphosphate-sugar epimerase